MGQPKVKWTPELAEKFKKITGQYPSGFEPKQEKYSDREQALVRIASQSFGNLPLQGKYEGSPVATADSLQLGLKQKPMSYADKLRSRKLEVDLQRSKLQLNKAKQETKKTENIEEKRQKLLNKMKSNEEILNKTKEDENYNVTPAYSHKTRSTAERANKAYNDSLKVLNLTEQFRQKGIPANTSHTRAWIKQGEQNIN